MTLRWHTSAALSFLLVGCFGSHGVPDGEPDSDAGTWSDAGEPPTTRPEPGPEPEPEPEPPVTGCRESGPAREVRVDVSSETGARCGYGSFDGAAIYDVSARPDVDGVAFRIDFCPDADDNCACDVVVSGVGSDVGADLASAPSSLLSVEVAPRGIVIERPCGDPGCGAGMCACVPTLVFAAVDGSLDDPPVRTEAVTAGYGTEVCRLADSGECDFVMWSLSLVAWSSGFPGAIGTEIVLEQGATVRGEDFTGLSLRSLRASGLDCGDGPPREGAWAAWLVFDTTDG